tara:strand:- start:802 stop:1119 length:318 start_codon:yes stop_codon:yes gene_type:complete
LENLGYYLAFYQEGVGVEDLYLSGFDMLNDYEKSKMFPVEEQVKYLANKLSSDGNQEKIKKWEHFNKLCEKDVSIIQGMIIGTITKTHVGDTPIDDLAEEKDGSD